MTNSHSVLAIETKGGEATRDGSEEEKKPSQTAEELKILQRLLQEGVEEVRRKVAETETNPKQIALSDNSQSLSSLLPLWSSLLFTLHNLPPPALAQCAECKQLRENQARLSEANEMLTQRISQQEIARKMQKKGTKEKIKKLKEENQRLEQSKADLEKNLEEIKSQKDAAERESKKEIAERDEKIAECDKKIAERDKKIAERDEKIAERDKKIAEFTLPELIPCGNCSKSFNPSTFQSWRADAFAENPSYSSIIPDLCSGACFRAILKSTQEQRRGRLPFFPFAR